MSWFMSSERNWVSAMVLPGGIQAGVAAIAGPWWMREGLCVRMQLESIFSSRLWNFKNGTFETRGPEVLCYDFFSACNL